MAIAPALRERHEIQRAQREAIKARMFVKQPTPQERKKRDIERFLNMYYLALLELDNQT